MNRKTSFEEQPDRDRAKALAALEAEVRAFQEHCARVGFRPAELRTLAQLPSISLRSIPLLIFLVAAVALICSATLDGESAISWHGAAIGRLLLIRALPFWDWRPLFRKPCLVQKERLLTDTVISGSLTPDDCAACEAVVDIQRISDTSYDVILNQHLIRGAPVIVTDCDIDWSLSKNPEVNLTRLLSNDERLRDSIPCVLQTNLRTGRQPADLNNILTKVANLQIPNWFVHFQNCDLQAVKSLRVLAPRPYFLSPHVPPAHFNWLLISNKYSAPRFKQLELDTGLIIVSQLKGSNLIQLTPRNPCGEVCPYLSFSIHQGETLVLANSMWNFEYMPDESGENTAILTETAWNEA